VAKALAPRAERADIDRSNRLVKTMADVLEYQAYEAKAKWADEKAAIAEGVALFGA
jgi:hypothetical protein